MWLLILVVVLHKFHVFCPTKHGILMEEKDGRGLEWWGD